MRTAIAFGLATGVALAAGVAQAHGDLHQRIEAASRAIEAAPGNQSFWLRRAELYRAHAERGPALADYERARALGPLGARSELSRAALLVESGRAAEAIAPLDRLVDAAPADVGARIARAHARRQLSDWTGVLADLDVVARAPSRPDPDIFLQRADAAVALVAIDRALAGLAEGFARLGQLAALERRALDIERAAGRFDAALARVDRLAAAAPRRESWLLARGEILEAAGRTAAARSAFSEALAAIDALPAHLRVTQSVKELDARARDALARLLPIPDS